LKGPFKNLEGQTWESRKRERKRKKEKKRSSPLNQSPFNHTHYLGIKGTP